MKAIKTTVMFLVIGLFAGIGQVAIAQNWDYLGDINGLRVYRDSRTWNQWTVTIRQVPSQNNGVLASAIVQGLPAPPMVAPNGRPYGPWRLPVFGELQQMYNVNGGGPILGIRNGLLDYYETAHTDVLANAYGNGFATPRPRIGVGDNWVIAIRAPW